jgi:acyl carrier protein
MLPQLEDIERAILKVCAALLNSPTVALQDNFLDLGGNSLRAAELSSRLRDAFGVEVPVDVVLSEDSFASLAVAVSRLAAPVKAG